MEQVALQEHITCLLAQIQAFDEALSTQPVHETLPQEQTRDTQEALMAMLRESWSKIVQLSAAYKEIIERDGCRECTAGVFKDGRAWIRSNRPRSRKECAQYVRRGYKALSAYHKLTQLVAACSCFGGPYHVCCGLLHAPGTLHGACTGMIHSKCLGATAHGAEACVADCGRCLEACRPAFECLAECLVGLCECLGRCFECLRL